MSIQNTAGEFAGLDADGKPIYSIENHWKAECESTYDELFKLRKENEELQARVNELTAALESIKGQTDGFDEDETYVNGIWMEVHHTAKVALETKT